MVQAHFRKTETTRNHPHQNIFATLTQVKTLHKLFLYKTILKPIWTYGIQLWGKTSTSNTEILELFQSKALFILMDAPWYVPNTVIQRVLHTPVVKEEFRRYSWTSRRNQATTSDFKETSQMFYLPDS
jgi:hypothetical protein